MPRHLADAYRLAVKAWDQNATESDRFDLKGFPEPLTCRYQEKDLASVNEDGEIDLLVGTLSHEQAQAFVAFVAHVFAPPVVDCHSIELPGVGR